MKRLLLLLLCALPLPASAQYTLAPETAKEYLELKAKVQKQPDDVDLQFEYATCLSYVGKVEQGLDALKRVRALDPEYARKTLPKYLKRTQDNPADLKAKYRLGFLYYFIEDYEQALKVLSEVANHAPAGQLNAWALGYMSVTKGKQKKWNEAEALVRRALVIEPEAYGLHAALAAALKKRGEVVAALGVYMTALEERRKFEEYEKNNLQ